MRSIFELLMKKIKTFGFDNVREIKVSEIKFEPSLLELCKQNQCGNYGKCHTCPPLIGEVDNLIEKARSFDKIIVFQKIYQLEDSFDIEGMNEGSKNFNILTRKVKDLLEKLPYKTLLLGAGGCRVCKRCSAIDNMPCRFPNKAIASLESYGINVYELASACDMKYINGQNTVTYFGGLFY